LVFLVKRNGTVLYEKIRGNTIFAISTSVKGLRKSDKILTLKISAPKSVFFPNETKNTFK